MSNRIPFYFEQLGLGATPSERDVKKAYASQLKSLDLATQPEAFAALRQNYDWALRHVREGWQIASDEEVWEEHTGQGGQEERHERNEQTDPPRTASNDPIDPPQSLQNDAQPHEQQPMEPTEPPQPQAIFEGNAASSLEHQEAQQRQALQEAQERFEQSVSTSPTTRDGLWVVKKLLQDALTDPDMIGFEQRDAFESWLIESLIAKRFGPHSGAVLYAAIECFGWQSHSGHSKASFSDTATLNQLLDDYSVLSESDRLELLDMTEGATQPMYKKPVNTAVFNGVPRLVDFAIGNRRYTDCLRSNGIYYKSEKISTWEKLKNWLNKDIESIRLPTAEIFIIFLIAIIIISIGQRKENNSEKPSNRSNCESLTLALNSENWREITASQLWTVNGCETKYLLTSCSDRRNYISANLVYQRLGGEELRKSSLNESIILRSNYSPFSVKDSVSCFDLANFVKQGKWLYYGDTTSSKKMMSIMKDCLVKPNDPYRPFNDEGVFLFDLLAQTDIWPPDPANPRKPSIKIKDLMANTSLKPPREITEAEVFAGQPACTP